MIKWKWKEKQQGKMTFMKDESEHFFPEKLNEIWTGPQM